MVPVSTQGDQLLSILLLFAAIRLYSNPTINLLLHSLSPGLGLLCLLQQSKTYFLMANVNIFSNNFLKESARNQQLNGGSNYGMKVVKSLSPLKCEMYGGLYYIDEGTKLYIISLVLESLIDLLLTF